MTNSPNAAITTTDTLSPQTNSLQLDLKCDENSLQQGLDLNFIDIAEQNGSEEVTTKRTTECQTERIQSPTLSNTYMSLDIHQDTKINKTSENNENKNSVVTEFWKTEPKAQCTAQNRSHGKHKSTLSFTRTVSEEVTWTDDEIDYDWSLNSTEIVPLESEMKINRPDSFPQILSQTQSIKDLYSSNVNNGSKEIIGKPQIKFKEPEGDVLNSSVGASISDAQFRRNTTKNTSAYDWPQTYEINYAIDQTESRQNLNENLGVHSRVSLLMPEKDQQISPKSPNFWEINSSKTISDHSNQSNEVSNTFSSSQKLGTRSISQMMSPRDCEPEEEVQIPAHETHQANTLKFKENSKDESVSNSGSDDLLQTNIISDLSLGKYLDNAECDKAASKNEDLTAKWRQALSEDVAYDNLLDDDDSLLSDDKQLNHNVHQQEIDPAALFGSDDEGFLDEDEGFLDSHNEHQNISKSLSIEKESLQEFSGETHIGGYARNPSINYVNSNVGILNSVHNYDNRSSGPRFNLQANYSDTQALSSTISAKDTFNSPPTNNPRQDIPKAKSFASMSKGGYSSPYDLPVDVVPRKRMSVQLTNRQTFSSTNTEFRNNSIPVHQTTPPKTSVNAKSAQAISLNQSHTTNSVKNTENNFFQDLPIASKPKLASRRSSHYSMPSKSQKIQVTTENLQSVTFKSESNVSIHAQPVYSQLNQGLSNPERVNPYSNLSTSSTTAVESIPQSQILPQNPSQFPQPTISQTGVRQYTHLNNSYHVSTNLRTHHPRTSSPLAQFNRSQGNDTIGMGYRSSSTDYLKTLRRSESATRPLSPTREVDEGDQSTTIQNHIHSQPMLPVPTNFPPQPNKFSSRACLSRTTSSPSKYSISNTSEQHPVSDSPPAMPPQRPRTQSPKSMLIDLNHGEVKNQSYQRSASVEPPVSIESSNMAFSPLVKNLSSKFVGHSHQELEYISPTDGRENDPLQRWKGSPVFAWGVGGLIVTSFPKNVPRYRTDQSSQMILRYPGELRIQSIKQLSPLKSIVAQFPGPISAKSKKKDILAWLKYGIGLLESNTVNYQSSTKFSHEKCLEERILLWKILHILIENNGNLEGSPDVQKAIRAVLCLEKPDRDISDVPLFRAGTEPMDFHEPNTSLIQPETIDPATVDSIKEHLSLGEAEIAVWKAVDKKLWAHAFLISNAISQDLYKRVTQEFVQKQVRIVNDSQPLAFLYEIFAGNFEESIDELVAPSARAGFEMVSTLNEGTSAKNALAGLDKWREALNLVLTNRKNEDFRALIALGNLLASYQRVEAAHICFLFARRHGVFSGIDDPLANIVLLGSDHLSKLYDVDQELESILLSEVLDYGISISNQNSVTASSPHLAVYKLHHAKILAEYGFRDKAIKYCVAITASIVSQTRRQPYHHDLLTTEVEDLTFRLKQSPKDETSSWISKPSIDKAKGSVWATFNKFVAGEESNTTENATNLNLTIEGGPFSKISGGKTTIDHSPSSIELPYSLSSSSGVATNISSSSVTVAGSRYTPSSAYHVRTPDLPLNNTQGIQNHQSTGTQNLSDYNPGKTQGPIPSTDLYQLRPQQTNSSDSYDSSQNNANFISQASYPKYDVNASTHQINPLIHQPPRTEQSLSDFGSSQISKTSRAFEDSTTSLNLIPHQDIPVKTKAFLDSYEVPTTNSYEPPPTEFEPLIDTVNDEYDLSNNDLAAQESNLVDNFEVSSNLDTSVSKEKSKAEKDRETDEAFRRAAEADAQKDKKVSQVKKGWGITSWFGGGTKNSSEEISSPNKPIRAKLGEASSFVYDPELKRWVNKKAGSDQGRTNSSISPPPKLVGPPKSGNIPPLTSTRLPTTIISASGNRPHMDKQNSSEKMITLSNSDNLNEGSSRATELSRPPPRPHSLTRSGSSNTVLPPSRPGTSMSNASSIDDLLGPPSVSRRSGVKSKKKGRGYVDVMSDVAA